MDHVGLRRADRRRFARIRLGRSNRGNVVIAAPRCATAATRARDLLDLPQPPVVLAYGIGVDSTAMLIELVARGEVYANMWAQQED